MIEIKNLSKKYAQTKALNSVSFSVKKGEVLGLLGPNGAGKTTTMKILTGFISSSSGKVLVDNLDIQENSLTIRKKIGYLPENNPLYDDMKVTEYLRFVSEIRSVKDNDRIKEITHICGLDSVLNKGISELSKGFRQRVGLASALMHDPEVLILDEPTTGLDPNQIVEIRSLIKKIGEQKTVILSTHILPEVQATCDRVVIINNGQISAQGTIDEITKQAQGKEALYIEVKGNANEIKQKIANLAEVASVSDSGHGLKIEAATEDDLREKIFDTVIEAQAKILEFNRISISLEDVFRELTTKEQ